MSDTFNDLKSEFDEAVAAAALFFNNGHKKPSALRPPPSPWSSPTVSVSGKGILFYDAIDDFKMTGHDGAPVTHKYTVSHYVADDGKPYCKVEYRRDDDPDCYAKFLAEDPTGAVAGADMVNYSSMTGGWDKLELGSSIATVEKESANQKITIYANAIGKVGVWTAPSDVLKHKGFTVTGNLYFKDIAQVGNAIYVNYNDDRIVFYQDDWTGTNFTAYLCVDITTLTIVNLVQFIRSSLTYRIPALEGEKDKLQIPASTPFTGVAWPDKK
ncbi:hypothetical protein BDZ97DRAFT_2026686 [Flammula alnicola]|nr:hypothetical protein BDZ97DRAFT_2026686 [Flammula alnicola]